MRHATSQDVLLFATLQCTKIRRLLNQQFVWMLLFQQLQAIYYILSCTQALCKNSKTFFSCGGEVDRSKEIEIIHRLFIVIAMYCQASSSLFNQSLNLPRCQLAGHNLKGMQQVHCKCLQGITGCLQVFPAIAMEKGYKNHREILYSSKEKIVYVVGKPCNIYRLRGNPIIIMGFPCNL